MNACLSHRILVVTIRWRADPLLVRFEVVHNHGREEVDKDEVLGHDVHKKVDEDGVDALVRRARGLRRPDLVVELKPVVCCYDTSGLRTKNSQSINK